MSCFYFAVSRVKIEQEVIIMKFNEYVYQRPDYEVVKKEFLELLDGFKQSNDGAEQRSYFKKINQHESI